MKKRDSQTLLGAGLAVIAIALIAWLSLDSWEKAAFDALVEEGHNAVQDIAPLDDPYMCADQPENC